jgi:hypothetical protein
MRFSTTRKLGIYMNSLPSTHLFELPVCTVARSDIKLRNSTLEVVSLGATPLPEVCVAAAGYIMMTCMSMTDIKWAISPPQ